MHYGERGTREPTTRRRSEPSGFRIDECTFSTSLFPKDGSCLLPLKNAVRKPHGLFAGDDVTVEITLHPRD